MLKFNFHTKQKGGGWLQLLTSCGNIISTACLFRSGLNDIFNWYACHDFQSSWYEFVYDSLFNQSLTLLIKLMKRYLKTVRTLFTPNTVHTLHYGYITLHTLHLHGITWYMTCTLHTCTLHTLHYILVQYITGTVLQVQYITYSTGMYRHDSTGLITCTGHTVLYDITVQYSIQYMYIGMVCMVWSVLVHDSTGTVYRYMVLYRYGTVMVLVLLVLVCHGMVCMVW